MSNNRDEIRTGHHNELNRNKDELSPASKNRYESVFDILRTLNYKGTG